MRTTRRMVQTMNVHDPIAFDTDRESNAKIQLKDQYEGRCFEGYLVETILAVERLGRTRINRVGDISQGIVEVQFVALCFRYHAGDAIAGMEILNKSAILTGRPAPKLVGIAGQGVVPAALSINEGNETLGVGQFVPVEIVSVTHPPDQPQAAAIVKPLTCRRKDYIWKVSQAAGETFAGDISVILGDFLEMLEARRLVLGNQGQAKAREFFAKQLSTYRQGAALPQGFSPVELDTKEKIEAWASSLAPGTSWVRPLEKSYDWVGVCQVGEGEVPENYVRIDASPEVVCTVLLNAISNTMKVLGDLPKVYHTEALVKNHVNVFMAMRNAQLSA